MNKKDSEAIKALFTDDFIRESQEQLHDFKKLMAYYRCAIMEIETKFNVLNEDFSLKLDRNPINSIKTRLKSPESILRKLELRGLKMTADNIERELTDVAGIRVICAFLDDVYTLADALLKQDDIRLIQKKDYISSPKENGYRSLHLIVEVPIFLQKEKRAMRAEIQLRTIAMDFWASLEHQLNYKKEDALSLEMINELKSCADLSASLDERMDTLRKHTVCDK